MYNSSRDPVIYSSGLYIIIIMCTIYIYISAVFDLFMHIYVMFK